MKSMSIVHLNERNIGILILACDYRIMIDTGNGRVDFEKLSKKVQKIDILT